MLINLNEFINHNTTVNILLATIQNMARNPQNVFTMYINDRGDSHGLSCPRLPLLSHSPFVSRTHSASVTPFYLNCPDTPMSKPHECSTWCGLPVYRRAAARPAAAGAKDPESSRNTLSVGRARCASPRPPQEVSPRCQVNLIKEQSAKRNRGRWGYPGLGQTWAVPRERDRGAASHRCQV